MLCPAELFPDHGIDLGEMTFGPQRKARSLDEKAKAPPKQPRYRRFGCLPSGGPPSGRV